MKVMIDLGTADIEMQRSDGTWERVEHCRARVNVDAVVLKVELAAVLTGAPLAEVRDCLRNTGATATPRLPRAECPVHDN